MSKFNVGLLPALGAPEEENHQPIRFPAKVHAVPRAEIQV